MLFMEVLIMKDLTKPINTEKVELTGMLSEFRDALNEEIQEIERSGQSSTMLSSGRRIESHSAEFWYIFNVEYLPVIPADTPCKLIINKQQYDVTVVSYEEQRIILASKIELPETIDIAKLENGSTVLMKLLIKCIETNANKENELGNHMFLENNEIYPFKKIYSYDNIEFDPTTTAKQTEAIKAALTNDITYIWGPPGTGKTTVIGQIISELNRHNRSVLVVSHTNTAIDGALERADKYYAKKHHEIIKPYPILRFGIPVQNLPKRVLLKQHIEELGEELFIQKQELDNKIKELQEHLNKIQPILNKHNWIIYSKLSEIQKQLQDIVEVKKGILQTQNELNEVIQSIEKEKQEHPDYGYYLFVSKRLNEKKNELAAVSGECERIETTIDDLHTQIQKASDEIKKHDRYSELSDKESEYMSEQFINEQISRISNDISDVETTISRLKIRQINSQKILDEYEKRSSVAKLFYNKNSLIKANAELSEISDSLSDSHKKHQQLQKLKDEYVQQLDAVNLIHEQMKAVTPSETKQHWEDVLSQLKNQLALQFQKKEQICNKKDIVLNDCKELESKQSETKIPFNKIKLLEQNRTQLIGALNNAQELFNQNNNNYFELLKAELSLCETFLRINPSKSNEENYNILYSAFSETKKELSNFNIPELKSQQSSIKESMSEANEQLNELNKKIQELEKQAILNAQVVGTTLTKTYISESLRERTFDTVILDEASMASIPALWCASYLAEKSIIIVGDFLQLSPIVVAKQPLAQKWLGQDIFHHSGMQEKAKGILSCPANFVMLNDQFRMESDIADVANMYYGRYGGLISNDNNPYRITKREEFYSWYSGKRTPQHIHLIDTKNLNAWVTGIKQGKHSSRFNCFSAVVSVDLAFSFIKNKLDSISPDSAKPVDKALVLIVAPYKPHVARIKQLIDLEYLNRGYKENLNYIKAGTIHSFQGSEADIVIFDLVIDEPHWRNNLCMPDEGNNEYEKMFNVAVTRAMFKLFIVGNIDFCKRRAKNNALGALLDKLLNRDQLKPVDVKKILPNLIITRQKDFKIDTEILEKHIVCQDDSFYDYFLSDIKHFKKRLIIYSPFMTEKRLSFLLPYFFDALSSGKKITIVTKMLEERGQKDIYQYQKCESELQKIGVSVLHKKGMHEKLVFVDSQALWLGSLNVLSFSGETGEIMHRHSSSALTAEYEKYYDIESICEVANNSEEQKCPICNSELVLKDGDSGGVYWGCIAGDYTRNTDQEYPTDGVLKCKKCGAPYVFGMKNEPRWICSENPNHFQRMKKSDLILEKMSELIPTQTARKEVDRYFAKKQKEDSAKHAKASAKKKSKSQSKTDDPQITLF